MAAKGESHVATDTNAFTGMDDAEVSGMIIRTARKRLRKIETAQTNARSFVVETVMAMASRCRLKHHVRPFSTALGKMRSLKVRQVLGLLAGNEERFKCEQLSLVPIKSGTNYRLSPPAYAALFDLCEEERDERWSDYATRNQ